MTPCGDVPAPSVPGVGPIRAGLDTLAARGQILPTRSTALTAVLLLRRTLKVHPAGAARSSLETLVGRFIALHNHSVKLLLETERESQHEPHHHPPEKPEQPALEWYITMFSSSALCLETLVSVRRKLLGLYQQLRRRYVPIQR
jgi:hypothetical protein